MKLVGVDELQILLENNHEILTFVRKESNESYVSIINVGTITVSEGEQKCLYFVFLS